MRVFAIGDIHGGLKGLKQVLSKKNFIKSDHLIFLGDYVDGWSESSQVIDYLYTFSLEYNCIFIKGNHDIWCENWLKDHKNINRSWYLHGGKETIESYENVFTLTKSKHLTFFKNMQLQYVDSKNRLFVHAGFTSLHGVERETYTHKFCTDRTLWEMAIAMDKDLKIESPYYPKRLKLYKEIFIGHTPTTNYNDSKKTDKCRQFMEYRYWCSIYR